MQAEAWLRLGFFILTFVLCAGIEAFRPKRDWRQSRLTRWRINLSIIALNTLIARFSVGAIAVTVAIWAQQQQFGLLQWLQLPWLASALVGFLLLDLAIWCQHLITHKWSMLWRLHRVHHSDLDLDVTTALRFHPVEIVLSLLYKAVIVLLLGVDPWVVILFEAILNASAIFSHANIKLSKGLDKILRWVICTPDMHRIHHSVHPQETDSNYGFFLSIWDRLFGTYRQTPEDGHLTMTLGLNQLQDPQQLGLTKLLILPTQTPEQRQNYTPKQP